jgi:outer membrane lipoprotein-sorting protein
MSNRTLVVPRIPAVTGKPVLYFVAALTVAAGALAPVTARAQTAVDVYKKMSDVYAKAKSYQGTIVRVEKRKMPDGKAASQTLTVKISYKAPNKYSVENKKSVTVGSKSESTDQFMVTDGKGLFMYAPDKKVYQRGKVQNDNLLARFFGLLNPVNGFVMQPASTVNGRPVFVLKPNMPVTGTAAQMANAKKVKVAIMIDKQTYQFLKLAIESPEGSLTQSAVSQTVNGNVPDSLFVWSPPAGYKEVTPPPAPTGGAPMPGGVPMPGRAPGR